MLFRDKIQIFSDALSWKFYHAHKLKPYKDIHTGKSCIIIGNGPSLNQMDLSAITDCYTIGLNKIFLIFKKIDLKLNYVVAVNKLVISQSVAAYNALQCPVFLSYSASKRLPFHSEKIHYLHTGNLKGFYPNICWPVYEGYTVTYVAMQIAYFMGFEKIYLVGVDHYFKQNGKRNEIQTMHGVDANHFDPGYFSGQHWQLADLVNSEISYQKARDYYEANDRNIYDATLNGKLTIFKKVEFSEAVQNCRM
ncbi:MAG: DUF115 domain-containing protein [Saprospiraceae bacterium]|nr:DUF115 domain-containing protein [Saprospiraceae bacterium]